MLRERKVDFAYVTPFDYLTAGKMMEVTPLASQLIPDGNVCYNAVLVSRKDSGIKTLDQARGKTIGLVHPDSVTGFKIFAYYLLKERRLPISEFFSKSFFTGSHLNSLERLSKGDFDVAATNTKDLQISTHALGVEPGAFNVIWKSAPLPDNLFIARADLSGEDRAMFISGLSSLGKDVLQSLKIGGFGKFDNSCMTLIKDLGDFVQNR